MESQGARFVPETNFDRKLSVLIKEWDLCEASIGRFDTISFAIRGWAVSVFTAVLAAAVTVKQPRLVLFAIAPTLLFWIFDALNKSFQDRFTRRLRAIQTYLKSPQFQEDLQSAEHLRVETPVMALEFQMASDAPFLLKLSRLIDSAARANVYVIYTSIIILSLVCWLVLAFNAASNTTRVGAVGGRESRCAAVDTRSVRGAKTKR
jgi:hypothetical protein